MICSQSVQRESETCFYNNYDYSQCHILTTFHGSDSDYSLWRVVVVNTQGALHPGAVTHNLDIKTIFSDSRTLSL